MKKITLCKGNIEYELRIDKYKIIVGTNYSKKFELMNIFRSSFECIKSSYSESNNLMTNILINDLEIDSKKCALYDLSPSFDLGSDLKMGSKSITYKYMDTILRNQLYFDSLNTINLLFLSLEEEINHEESDIRIALCDFNYKMLMKLISTFIVIEDEKANMYDLTYEEHILLQLKMISKIVENSVCEETFIILDIPILTKKMFYVIEKLQRCSIFIFTNEYENELDINDVFICSQYPIDLADEGKIYSVFCEEYNVLYELKEIQIMLNNYVNNIRDEFTELIIKILE